MYYAIKNGNTEFVNNFVPSFNKEDQAELVITPMSFAALCGHTWLIQALMPITTPSDPTLFHYIACGGSVSFAQACLDLGFPANKPGRDGLTPLHVACANKNEEMAEFILENCISDASDLLITDSNGWNAAHHAAAVDFGNVLSQIIKMTDKKVFLSKDNKGRTPFHIASMCNSVECIKILLNNYLSKKDSESLLTIQDNCGFNSLHLACLNGASYSASYLIERGARIDSEGRNNFTPLHVAAAAGKAECCVLLLTRGAPKEAPAVNGARPLHLAAKNGDVRTLAVLLENGCKVDGRDDAGMTPLHVAAYYNRVGAIQILVQNKADVNAKDGNGNCPLALAVSKGSISSVKELLKCSDVNVELQNNNGDSTLHIAGRVGASHAINIIMTHAWKEYTHSLLVK